jgi:Tfp pilus assembly protein PilZ
MYTTYTGYFQNGHFVSLESEVIKIPDNVLVLVTIIDDTPITEIKQQENANTSQPTNNEQGRN